MKQRVLIDRMEALDVLARCGALADYHTLSTASVERLTDEADSRKYRKAPNAPGSRTRMFHAYLTKRARLAY